MEVTQEVCINVGGHKEMTLLKRIRLLDWKEWTPEVCTQCSKQNPQHTKLDCPVYEQCLHYKGSSAYGYLSKHRCTTTQEDTISLNEGNDCNYDLYWNDNCHF